MSHAQMSFLRYTLQTVKRHRTVLPAFHFCFKLQQQQQDDVGGLVSRSH